MSTSKANPSLALNNGVSMPALGLGVYQSAPDDTISSVQRALACGYRLIDTAAAYGNEKEVGKGVTGSGIDRSEVFVTTKLWISDYGQDAALRAFDRSLRKLGLDYLDLYLLHWPVPSDFDATVASWKAAERLLSEGRVRAIGVCNFSPVHLDRLIERSDIVPAVNQVELHPFFAQASLAQVHRKLGIVTQAWSPIGGVKRYWAKAGEPPQDPLQHPVVLELSRKHGKTPAQIILRWHIDHGYSAIPKSVRPERIAENFDIFDFTLSAQELADIDRLHSGDRGGPDPETVDTSLFKLAIED